MSDFSYIKKNLEEVNAEISALAEKYGRDVTLVAVTKSATDEELIALAEYGISDIGENRPGELKRRGELLLSHGYSPRLHEIGNLQRNKVKLVVSSAHLIHSVGKEPLADEINRQALALGIKVPVLAEINSAKEENKSGAFPEDADKLCAYISSLEGLQLKGLMTMGPPDDDAEVMRPYFRLTKELYDNLGKKYGFSDGGVLSMGMSDSYRVAIEEGSTLVRVGRRLFKKEGE